MEEIITYSPDISSILRWLVISGIIILIATFLALRFLKPDPNKGKLNSLFFMLSGFMGLIAVTIFAFMLFNWIRTGPVQLSTTELIINAEVIPLHTIRKTQIHREGNGIPFQGLGVNKDSNNSLIIETSDGKTKILSEDFYPISEIAKKVKENKMKLKAKN